jgi:hypothetical protein
VGRNWIYTTVARIYLHTIGTKEFITIINDPKCLRTCVMKVSFTLSAPNPFFMNFWVVLVTINVATEATWILFFGSGSFPFPFSVVWFSLQQQYMRHKGVQLCGM